MNVKLVSYSAPTEEWLFEGLDDLQDLIAFCAKFQILLHKLTAKQANVCLIIWLNISTGHHLKWSMLAWK